MSYFLGGIAVMAGVTWLTRAVPLMLVRGRIKSRFIRSLLFYLPYAVLGAMTFPAIIYATASTVSAAAGAVIALILAYFRQSLLVVAVAATSTVLLAEWLLTVI